MQQKRTLSEVATSFILLGCFGAAWFYVAGPVGLMVAITVLIAFRLQIALFDESNRLNIARWPSFTLAFSKQTKRTERAKRRGGQ